MAQLPATMTVIAIRAPGGPDVLTPGQRPLPVPGAGEVLVKVAAAGINRPDVMQRQGLYPPPKGATDIPGLEIAGEVIALGNGVGTAGDKHLCARRCFAGAFADGNERAYRQNRADCCNRVTFLGSPSFPTPNAGEDRCVCSDFTKPCGRFWRGYGS
jgi:D-arabinose 1-dehydrogenase-like Zn-dependent alcohol dehydrogenase